MLTGKLLSAATFWYICVCLGAVSERSSHLSTSFLPHISSGRSIPSDQSVDRMQRHTLGNKSSQQADRLKVKIAVVCAYIIKHVHTAAALRSFPSNTCSSQGGPTTLCFFSSSSSRCREHTGRINSLVSIFPVSSQRWKSGRSCTKDSILFRTERLRVEECVGLGGLGVRLSEG